VRIGGLHLERQQEDEQEHKEEEVALDDMDGLLAEVIEDESINCEGEEKGDDDDGDYVDDDADDHDDAPSKTRKERNKEAANDAVIKQPGLARQPRSLEVLNDLQSVVCKGASVTSRDEAELLVAEHYEINSRFVLPLSPLINAF
jgi:hypothetical protein